MLGVALVPVPTGGWVNESGMWLQASVSAYEEVISITLPTYYINK